MTHVKRINLKNIILIGIVTAMLSTSFVYVYGFLTYSSNINSSGIIANTNIGVFSNSAATTNMTTINWGVCYPGTNYPITAYIKNLGTVNETLSFQTTSWNPSTASTYLILTTNYSGQTITPGQVIQITLTLKVSSSITGITSFNFNIVITSQG